MGLIESELVPVFKFSLDCMNKSLQPHSDVYISGSNDPAVVAEAFASSCCKIFKSGSILHDLSVIAQLVRLSDL